MRATTDDSCTMQQRLAVHRVVEWLADRVACTADADGELPSMAEACREAGIRTGTVSPAMERLYRDELTRAIARREETVADGAWSSLGEEWEEVLPSPPQWACDPYGELAGGRAAMSHLIGRRIDEAAGGEEVMDGQVDSQST